jgi:SAM-dependent methyltransferase
MDTLLPGESREKKRAALLSVGSALLLVSLKSFLVIRTGSLGVLSEALHSGLDFIAAVITFLSPGLRFFHQGQFEGRTKRISPHLVRAPAEAVDENDGIALPVDLDGHALDFVSEFDAVFSNMALHWMRKPKLVIEGVYRALKPRGRFVAEFGGHGNVAAIATAMRAVGALRNGNPELVTPWFFPTVEEYGALLTEGGFTVKQIALVPRLTPLRTGIEGWLRTFGRSFFDRFAEPERTKVVGKVIELLRPSLCDSRGKWTADHVRVRFIAERGA